MEKSADLLIECLDCGRMFRSLGMHVRCAHGMHISQYLSFHRLPQGTRTTSDGCRERKRKAAIASGQPERLRAMEHVGPSKSQLEVRDSLLRDRPRSRKQMENAPLRDPELQSRLKAIRIDTGKTLVKRCALCGSLFESGSCFKRKFCSVECSKKSPPTSSQIDILRREAKKQRQRALAKGSRVIRTCHRCKSVFERKKAERNKYCSDFCRLSTRRGNGTFGDEAVIDVSSR